MHPFIARNLVYLPGQYVRGLSLLGAMEQLAATERYAGEALRAHQWSRAQALLQHAWQHAPLYRQRMAAVGITPADIKNLEDWRKLPPLSKDDIATRRDELLAEKRPWRLSTKTTGGSTGRAVTVVKDRRAQTYEDAAMYRGLAWNGVGIGDRQARFWGVPLRLHSRLRYRAIDTLMNRVRFSAFACSDPVMRHFYDILRRFRPVYFYGYTSVVVEFARYIQRAGLDPTALGVRLIVTTSEPLYPQQRELLCQVFACRVIKDYGCGEVGPIAYQCERDGFHIFTDTLLVEVLKDNREAAPGETGEIVITDLHNYAMPLIRYQIKDYAVPASGVCSCGRTLPLLESVVGRVLDTIVLPGGKRIHGEYFNYIAEEMKRLNLGLHQLQVIQSRPDRLLVKVVKDPQFTQASLQYLERQVRTGVGADVEIAYESVTEIPREASGKMRLVISRC